MNISKFQKILSRKLEKHNGKCTCCKKKYAMNTHTFSGFDYDGKVQDVGYCCIDKIDQIVLAGIYMIDDSTTEEGRAIYEELLATHPLNDYI